MKVFVENMILGCEYWMDRSKKEKGIFVGIHPCEEDDTDNSCFFYVSGKTDYLRETDGTVGFWIGNKERKKYEEV